MGVPWSHSDPTLFSAAALVGASFPVQRAIPCLCQVATEMSYILKCLEWHQYTVWINMGAGQVAQRYSACPYLQGPGFNP